MLKVIHSADWHISRNIDKRDESERCVRAMLAHAGCNPPDLFVLSGDLVDELDGRIMLDSDAARVAISLVESCAELAPVAIVRGTKSHDRDAPTIFRHLRTRYPVHVSTSVEQIMLVWGRMYEGTKVFLPVGASIAAGADVLAVLTMVPSLDKAYFNTDTIADGNRQYRQLLFDLFAGLGLVNDAMPAGVPRIFVGHGMLTGSSFSTGQTAIGEDMEFGLNDLAQAKCDAVMLGHVHKFQRFGNVVYSGSPGRLNFGEVEEKGFVKWLFSPAAVTCDFVPLPARKFHFVEAHIAEGMVVADYVEAAVAEALSGASGADVRLRFDIPEEFRHTVNREEIEQRLLEAGARRVKIEMQVIPKQRQRAAGISRATTLPEKLVRWAEAVDETVPPSVMDMAGRIEGMSIEELLAYQAAPAIPAEVVSATADLCEAVLEDMVDGLCGQDREPHLTVQGSLF